MSNTVTQINYRCDSISVRTPSDVPHKMQFVPKIPTRALSCGIQRRSAIPHRQDPQETIAHGRQWSSQSGPVAHLHPAASRTSTHTSTSSNILRSHQETIDIIKSARTCGLNECPGGVTISQIVMSHVVLVITQATVRGQHKVAMTPRLSIWQIATQHSSNKQRGLSRKTHNRTDSKWTDVPTPCRCPFSSTNCTLKTFLAQMWPTHPTWCYACVDACWPPPGETRPPGRQLPRGKPLLWWVREGKIFCTVRAHVDSLFFIFFSSCRLRAIGYPSAYHHFQHFTDFSSFRVRIVHRVRGTR
jgi:hypothetical protein